MKPSTHSDSTLKTWIIILALVGLVFAQGGYTYFVVGDLGQPGWDYRAVPDLPGESPYAIYRVLPYPQHVRGASGE